MICACFPKILVTGSLTSIGDGGLNLEFNRLGDEGWGAIFVSVCGSSVSKIASIDASSENISPEGAKPIAEALRTSINASLTSLSLGQNELGDEGTIVIARALKESKVSKLAFLDLSGKGYGTMIGPAGAKELAEYISFSSSLTRPPITPMDRSH